MVVSYNLDGPIIASTSKAMIDEIINFIKLFERAVGAKRYVDLPTEDKQL